MYHGTLAKSINQLIVANLTFVFFFQKFADEFYSTFNNTQYNTIEPDICHLIYVAQLEILKENEVNYLTTNTQFSEIWV